MEIDLIEYCVNPQKTMNAMNWTNTYLNGKFTKLTKKGSSVDQ